MLAPTERLQALVGQWLAENPPPAAPSLLIADLIAPAATCDYAATLAAMEALSQRPPHARDVLLLLEHPPVATLGRRGGDDHLHGTVWQSPDGRQVPVELHRTGRGGNVTMHAPGQLVGYPIVQLPLLQPPIGRGTLGDLPAYVRALEQALIDCCSAFGVAAMRREGFAGVWIDEREKIASIGIAVQRGWSSHGFALNVSPDLGLFSLMTPCGLSGARLTSLGEQLARRGMVGPSVADVAADIAPRLAAALRRQPLQAAAVGV